MQNKHSLFLISCLGLIALLVGAFGTTLAFAKGHSQHVAHVSSAVSAHSVAAKMVASYSVDMHHVAASARTPSPTYSPRARPFLTHVSARQKAAAAHNQHAPHFKALPATALDSSAPDTPPTVTKFPGMADAKAICPPFGCQPADVALATSPQFVFQGVNTAYAVYDPSGHIQAGWPKTAQDFFDVPPVGTCDPAGPFLSDPRAVYDINTGHFWTASLQVEGAFGIPCSFTTLYWIAVSQTSDPTGTWNIYAFDMSLGTMNAADYTMIGFDARAFYFSANMFDQTGTTYEYAEIFGVNKQHMENGQGVTAFGFAGLEVNGVLVDTVQPVQGELPTYAGPRDGLFINSFNIDGDPNGRDCISTVCQGVEVWALDFPGTAHTTLAGVYVDTPGYAVPPDADQPGCTLCLETFDTRITAIPVFNDGQISWALNTGASFNGLQVVPAIFWGQVVPQISNGHLLSGVLYQSGYFGFEGDQAASFGALMPDNNGNLIMVYDTMSQTLNPSIAYTARRATFPLGSFRDQGKFLKKGIAPTKDFRWGEYEASSYDGFATDTIWVSAQYSGVNQDWHTFIGKVQFRLK